MSAGDSFFVDSNLLLYFVDPVQREKQIKAEQWLDALWQSGAGRLSSQVLHEFYWNAVKKMRLQPGKAREIVEDLSHWSPVDSSLGMVQEAWQWVDSAQLSIGTPSSWRRHAVPARVICYLRTFRPAGTMTMSRF